VPGTSIVIEDWDDDGRPSGRFDAHWESDDGQDHRDGPEGVPVEEALAWARAQASAVYVRTLDGDEYSAGTEHLEDVPQRWPEGGLTFAPRPLATRWEVAARVPTHGALAADGGAPFLDLLATSPRIAVLRTETEDDGSAWAICVVDAESAHEAAIVLGERVPMSAYDLPPGHGGPAYESIASVRGPAAGG
jgi:hypothetical protein